MNKHIDITKEKIFESHGINFKNTSTFNDLELFVIGLARLWFSGEHLRREIDRDLTVQFGYFKGFKVNRSINEFFSLVSVYHPTMFANYPNYAYVNHDEIGILKLIFPKYNCGQDISAIARIFVPATEIGNLIRLAKNVNISLM